jgi:hypothetical protein
VIDKLMMARSGVWMRHDIRLEDVEEEIGDTGFLREVNGFVITSAEIAFEPD